jgi:hypothetical protein
MRRFLTYLMFACTVAAIAASGWYMSDRFGPFPSAALFVHMAIATTLWLVAHGRACAAALILTRQSGQKSV